jgi:hypothetical protein
MKNSLQRSFSMLIIISILMVSNPTSAPAQSNVPDIVDQPQSTKGDVVNLSVPMVRQVWDTADDFNGNCACGPTSAVMALAYFQKIRPIPITVSAGGSHTTDYGFHVSNEYAATNGRRFSQASRTCSPPFRNGAWAVNGAAKAGAWGSTTSGGNGVSNLILQYLLNHGIEAEFLNRASTNPSDDKAVLRQALSQGFPVITSVRMKGLSHIVLVRGYTDDDQFILNDPYGTPSDANYTSGGSRGGENVRVRFQGGSVWTAINWFIIVKGQGGANTPRRDTDDNRRFDNFGQTKSGTIDPNNDDDIYWFNGTAGASAKLNLNTTAGGLDAYLELYTPDGRLLARNDDANGTRNSEIQVSLPTTGDYKIIAHSYNLASNGRYDLALNSVSNTDTDDSRQLPSTGSMPGTITPTTDRDTYYFSGSAGTVVNLRMNKTDAALDSYLELYSPTGAKLAENDDGGGNRNSWIAYRLPVNGAYRVVARSFNFASSGRYNISLQTQRTNYALSLAPDASSQEEESISPAYATDGDTATAWSSGEAAAQRLMLDLGETRTINQAIIRWNGGDYATGYGLYYQDSNGAWQPLFATDSGNGDVDVLEFASITTAHVLIEMWQKPELVNGYSISEFEVHNTDSVLIPLVPPDDTDKPEETNVTPLVPLAPDPEGKDAAAFALGSDQESFPLSDADATSHAPSVQVIDTYRFPTTTLTLSGDLLLLGGSITATAVNPHDQDSHQVGTGITAYRWTLIPTDIGPSGGFVIPVGDQATLTLSSSEKLDPGQYHLQLEVQDDEGSWSQPVSELITISWNLFLPMVRHN